MKNKAFFLFFVMLMAGQLAYAHSGDICLSQGWKLQSSKNLDKTWYQAEVPSTVRGALGHNEDFTVPWIYEKEFSLSKLRDSQNAFLEFDGISYRANIWLNGHLVADKNSVYGPYRQFRFNVTNLIAEENVLRVEVFGARDGEFNIGFVDWNPRPEDESMGIFRPVWLRFSEEVSVHNPVVRSRVDTSTLKRAWLDVEVGLENNTSAPVEGHLVLKMEGRKFSKKVLLGPGELKTVNVDASQAAMLDIKSPKLWWCHNMGKPEMHRMDVEFVVGKKNSDTQSVDFGIRQIDSYFTPEGHRGYILNGRKVLIKGAGWTDDIYLRNPDARNEIELSYVKDMNLNAVRFENIWGTSQNVYDLCDRMGLLALVGWSCFWEWEVYSRTPNDKYGCIKSEEEMDLIAESLHNQVVWLRNHPSIIAWYVGSDMLPRPELEKKYLKVLSRVDTTRPYVGASKALVSEVSGPTGMKMVGPYDYQAPSYWYCKEAPGGSFGFNTETGIGAQMPMRESIEKMIPLESLWPVGEEYDRRCTTAAEAMHSLDVLKDVMSSRYGQASDLDDFLRKAHHLDYDGTRAMFEGFRVARPASTGVIQWMLNSAWPSVYWQLYDWYLTPCASYYSVKKACAPHQLVYNYQDKHIYAVNDEGSGFAGKACWELYSIEGRRLHSGETPFEIGADSSVCLDEIPVNDGVTFLFLNLKDKKGNLIQDNTYALSSVEDITDWEHYNWIRIPLKQCADYTSLDDMPYAKVNYTFKRVSSNSYEVLLENDSDCVAFFLRLSVKDGNGELVTPAYWEDNFISLTPGQKRAVKVKIPKSRGKVTFELNGWNL